MIFNRQEGVGAAIALLNRLVEESILANTQEWPLGFLKVRSEI